MNTEQRARFEALFPVPDGIFYYEQFGKYRAADPANQWSIAMVLSNKFTGFQAAETPLLDRIAELERRLANREVLCLPAEELKELIYSIHGSHHVGDAQHTKLDIINAQIDSLYANREPFVVKLPEPHKKFMDDESCAQFGAMSFNNGRYGMARFNHGLEAARAAITAAGGVCE